MMAGFHTANDDGLISDINVTPFVDISLVLLIIFMSTSAVIVRTALELEIPVASNAEETNSPEIQSVLLNADNSLALNGVDVTAATMVSSLEATVAKNKNKSSIAGGTKDTQALISATGKHDYQQVVDLIDLVKGTGVHSIALNTKTDPEKDVEE